MAQEGVGHTAGIVIDQSTAGVVISHLLRLILLPVKAIGSQQEKIPAQRLGIRQVRGHRIALILLVVSLVYQFRSGQHVVRISIGLGIVGTAVVIVGQGIVHIKR